MKEKLSELLGLILKVTEKTDINLHFALDMYAEQWHSFDLYYYKGNEIATENRVQLSSSSCLTYLSEENLDTAIAGLKELLE